VTAVIGVALLALLPVLAPTRLAVYSNALTFVVMFLSLALLLNTSGQISLAHAAFVAVGATTFSHLTTGAHLPWMVAFLGAGLVTVPVGALLAIPATRLSGVYLALATFGFGILAQNVVFNTWLMFGSDTFLKAPRPVFAFLDGRDDKQFFYFVLAVAVVATLAVVGMLRSRLGRLLRAMADAPTALTTQGLNVQVTRVLVFCVSAFLAGVCGALFISQFGQITRDSGFGPFQSLIWVAVLTVCGSRVIPASFLAAGLLIVVPSYLSGVSLDTQTLLFGLGALAAAVLGERRFGWREAGRRWAENSQHRRDRSPVAARTVVSRGGIMAEARP
jgi:ABC-type branched-subunit amino acid transport system permease subunit